MRVCIDFDGVIHAYTSGWQGPREIPDPPVPGALEAVEAYLDAGLQVAVYSSRSKSAEAWKAMRGWLRHYGFPLDRIETPTQKPPAQLYIDDRGFHFQGKFPSVEFIRTFKPWNKRGEDGH